MATKSPLRLASLSLRCSLLHQPTTKRTFLTSFLPNTDKPLHINVSRTLPYPRAQLYNLIADVDSYSKFLPYCKHSRVTAWTTITTPQGGEEGNDGDTTITEEQEIRKREKWPAAGELSLGWGPLDHTYTSRIVCVPGRSVEAHSGVDEPLCREADEQQQRGGQNPFRKLSTRWTLSTSYNNNNNKYTKVDLGISMTLRDPMAQVVLSRMVDGVAEEMIQAFERRAEELFGRGGS